MEELEPAPLLAGMQLQVAAVVAPGGEGDEATAEKMVVVPVPTQFSRFVEMPSEEGTTLARLEEVIAENMAAVVPGCQVLATGVFRITRDADVTVHDDDASDLLQAVEEAVLARRRRAAVRLEISTATDARIKKWLTDWLEVRLEDVYVVDGMLDAKALMEIVGREGFQDIRQPDWPPQPPRDLIGSENLWQTLDDRDVLLFHPYESFDPVVRMLEEAADDKHVLAIKQTLYRTSGDSPVVGALERAAASGKEVTVLVELKARFDEAQNVGWARRLENAGCHVIYGIAGFKTHAKALLIIRREGRRIRRYVHLATGNYNDKTARLYSDLGLMTSDRDMAADVATFFNLLTGYSEMVGWSKLAIAPTGLRQRFLDMIDREIQASTPDHPGLIMAKVNSLEDPDICRALYEASQAGVRVRLNVRGICCLRPDVKGVSENIEVCSVIDRFLEHARVFYFRNGGHEEVYLGSADWMRRNLDQRLEILFPVAHTQLRKRIVGILEKCFADNMKSRRLLRDGSYEALVRKGRRVRAQEEFHKAACEATRSADRATTQFRPLTRPEQ